ncbi:MAG: efflux RND transporter periplasmic adaptor subunit [Candidatus Aminicenantes bacterium]|nr:efflux RND transporter periplasmic adaptor subunit [Candidatus Aminicenantes bacterium]
MKQSALKTSLIIIGFILTFFACGPRDNRTELERLIEERDELNERIAQLKAEDSTQVSEESSENSIPVRISEVKSQEFKHFITVQGTVESESNILVSPQTPGLVRTIHVQTGDRVNKGQILAELDASVIKRSIEEVEGGLELARTVYERRARLWEKNIGSEIEYLQAKNSKESLEKKLQTLQEQYQMTLITAPISGSIDEVMIKEGEMAVGGYGAFRIVQLSRLKITASLSENYITHIQQNDIAQISIPVVGKDFEQKLHAVSQVIDPNNRTFKVEIRVPREIKNIKPNMLALVTINDYTNPQALVVPRNIIQKTGVNNFLFVAETEDGIMKARKRVVKVGEEQDSLIEITEGLNPGEQVVVFGFQNLGDGQIITVNGIDNETSAI